MCVWMTSRKELKLEKTWWEEHAREGNIEGVQGDYTLVLAYGGIEQAMAEKE